MSNCPCVFIVLVNWDGLADTRECLTSLAQIEYLNARVVVVDNGSRGEDVAAIRSEFPDVTLIETGANLGFTGGNAAGIRYALAGGADYVLCLNNDTVVAPDFLGPLVRALEEDPAAGIATSAIYYYDAPEKLSALGNWLDLSDTAPAGQINGQHEDRSPSLEQLQGDVSRVPAVDGCVLLMRRSVAEVTKGFDDRLFAYMEDIDLCLRAGEHGWHCLAVRPSRVWHKIGSTSGGQNSLTAMHYYTRNGYYLVNRHGDAAQKTAFRKKLRARRLAELDFYLREIRRGPEARWGAERALDYVVTTYLAALGCQGRRDQYRTLEAAMRNGLVLLAPILRLPFSLYLRVYWKFRTLGRA